MTKKMISQGVLSNLPGICYGDRGMEYNPVFTSIIDNFFTEGERTLEDAIDHDMSEWDVPDNLLLWTICRSTVVDSFVLRQFASDCIEHTGPVLAPGEEDLVAEAVECARSYATAGCNHETLIETQDKMMARIEDTHFGHFFGVVVHTLAAHPDAGALQCVMNLPRCYVQTGNDSAALGVWMKAAFRQRCQDAGFFDEA
jgi:hypothetical protein